MTEEALKPAESGMVEMTEEDFATLHRCVTLAKDHQIHTVRKLTEALLAEGYERASITTALVFWGAYEKDKQTGWQQAA